MIAQLENTEPKIVWVASRHMAMRAKPAVLPGQYVWAGLLIEEQLAPSQSLITLRAEEKALRVMLKIEVRTS